MSNEISDLYAQLLGQTARMSWAEIMPIFAKGMVLWVASNQDLGTAWPSRSSKTIKERQCANAAKALHHLKDEQALDFQQRDPELWAVVVAPWLISARASNGRHTTSAS